jgi:hypothetical protein
MPPNDPLNTTGITTESVYVDADVVIKLVPAIDPLHDNGVVVIMLELTVVVVALNCVYGPTLAIPALPDDVVNTNCVPPYAADTVNVLKLGIL